MKTKKHRENLIKMACIYYTRWAQENQASKGCLVFYISRADENRAAVRYRRLENSERKRRNFASRRDAERSAEVRYAPPEKPPNF